MRSTSLNAAAVVRSAAAPGHIARIRVPRSVFVGRTFKCGVLNTLTVKPFTDLGLQKIDKTHLNLNFPKLTDLININTKTRDSVRRAVRTKKKGGSSGGGRAAT